MRFFGGSSYIHELAAILNDNLQRQTMKEINLQSPTILEFDTTNGIIYKMSHQMYTDIKLGVKLPVSFSVFFNLTEKGKDGRFILPIDGQAIFGEESVKILHEIKSTIGRCSQIGELLFAKLKRVNSNFKSQGIYNDIFDPIKEKYNKLDFMGHRDVLSKILKSNKSAGLINETKKYNLKSVTTSFHKFILDRNKYTHGELMSWYPERKTILEYENEARQPEYGEVNKDILNSYISCYKDLDEFLNLIDNK